MHQTKSDLFIQNKIKFFVHNLSNLTIY